MQTQTQKVNRINIFYLARLRTFDLRYGPYFLSLTTILLGFKITKHFWHLSCCILYSGSKPSNSSRSIKGVTAFFRWYSFEAFLPALTCSYPLLPILTNFYTLLPAPKKICYNIFIRLQKNADTNSKNQLHPQLLNNPSWALLTLVLWILYSRSQCFLTKCFWIQNLVEWVHHYLS